MTTTAPRAPGDSFSRLPAPSRLRVSAAGAAVAGLAAVTVAAAVVHAWLAAGRAGPMVAAGVFASMMAVMLAAMGGHHPFPRWGPANAVTMVRAMLAAFAASLLVAGAAPAAAWVVVTVTILFSLLDGADGRLARRTGLSSAFGARFDMETDAFFMLVLSLLVWRHGKAGIWVMGIGLMRYGFVAAGWRLTWLSRPLRPTQRGRAVAALQIMALGTALAPVVPVPWSATVSAVALATLAWSFALDVRYLWEHQAADTGGRMP